MNRLCYLLLGSLVASMLWTCESVAQGPAIPRPSSDSSSYVGREMNRLYRESIGRGYTGSELNRLSAPQLIGGNPSTAPVVSSIGRSGGVNPGPKPFTGISTAPTVSPYLNLFNDSFEDVGNSQYITNVRPMLEQQRTNQQLQLQQQELSRRVQQISAQPDFAMRGSESQYPTGHPTVFLNTGRYYPGNLRRR